MSIIIINAELQKQLTVGFFYRSLFYLGKSKKASFLLFDEVLFYLKQKAPDKEPLEFLSLSLSLVTPFIGLKSKKVAGSLFIKCLCY